LDWLGYPRVWTVEAEFRLYSAWSDKLLEHPQFSKVQRSDEVLIPILMETMLRRELIDTFLAKAMRAKPYTPMSLPVL
jgi:hypothetical protein